MVRMLRYLSYCETGSEVQKSDWIYLYVWDHFFVRASRALRDTPDIPATLFMHVLTFLNVSEQSVTIF